MELVEGATLAAVCDRLRARSGAATKLDRNSWQQTLSTVWEESRQAEEPIGDAAPDVARLAHTIDDGTDPTLAGATEYVPYIVELIRQAAQAAHALHESGVVHRDIKPGNIMVTADGGSAVLMDLGLAQLADELDGKLTRTRQFVGTLRYASPEQVLAVGHLDRKSDVYSLGATLWELLTFRPLYDADEGTPTPELMKRIQYEDPKRVRAFNPDVPADLEAIVMKCLERNPDRRYATARELADDLGRWLRKEPVVAHSLTLAYRLSKRVRRQRRALAIVAVLLVAQVALGLALYHYFAPSAAPQVESFVVSHFRGAKAHPEGEIGRLSIDVREDDDVRVTARFNRPGYCFLIAFNPDGKDQLCYPSDPAEPPAKITELDYPRDQTHYFPLTDGVGLQVFVLVVSWQPLPAYRDWRGQAPWRKLPAADDDIWQYDGRRFNYRGQLRAPERERQGAPAALQELIDFVKARPGVEAVQALAFPVKKK